MLYFTQSTIHRLTFPCPVFLLPQILCSSALGFHHMQCQWNTPQCPHLWARQRSAERKRSAGKWGWGEKKSLHETKTLLILSLFLIHKIYWRSFSSPNLPQNRVSCCLKCPPLVFIKNSNSVTVYEGGSVCLALVHRTVFYIVHMHMWGRHGLFYWRWLMKVILVYSLCHGEYFWN